LDKDPAATGPVTPPNPELEPEVAALHDKFSAELLAYAASIARDRDAARDAVQEAFLRYFVERSYGRLVAHPRAWLYRVLRNYLLDRMDSAAVRREVGPENAVDVPDRNHGPEAAVGNAQVAIRIRSLLSPREFECLCLRADGLSYDEMAEVLGIRPGTVSSLLTRLHRKLHDAALDRQSGTLEALQLLVAGGKAHSS
jgi:RNA polymerase sigma-70 factor (ECF subfamily)